MLTQWIAAVLIVSRICWCSVINVGAANSTTTGENGAKGLPWASKARGRGTRPPQSKNQRGRPPRNDDISASFFLTQMKNFAFSTIFKIKWPKSEEKLNFGGSWVWVPMNPSPPQTKHRGDASGAYCETSCCISGFQPRLTLYSRTSLCSSFAGWFSQPIFFGVAQVLFKC